MNEQLNQEMVRDKLKAVKRDLDEIAILISFWTQMELAGGRRTTAQQNLAALTGKRNEAFDFKKFLESKLTTEDNGSEKTEGKETDGEM